MSTGQNEWKGFLNRVSPVKWSQGMLLAMAALHGNGCRLLVAGRVADSGGDGAAAPEFLTLADVEMSKELQDLVRC